ncbi:MAG: carboxypeptidase-like regulatory domain-containing protein [Acidobacteriaceae bacterium]
MSVVLLAGWVIVGGWHAAAATTSRSVRGRVVSAGDSPVSSAIVYLSNARTMTVQSYITQEDGAYRFEQMSPSDDYKLWAQAEGNKSKVKTLSSFDDRAVFHVILKVDSLK